MTEMVMRMSMHTKSRMMHRLIIRSTFDIFEMAPTELSASFVCAPV